jgi:hypothetical protein
MLKLTRYQLEAMPVLTEATLRGKIKHRLNKLGIISAELSPEATDETISVGIYKASHYELSSEYSITLFILLQFAIAKNLDLDPHVQEILSDKSIPPDSRMDVLFERLPCEQWSALSKAIP